MLPRLVFAGLTRVRSATDGVVSLDLVSWLRTAAAVKVSGSSGRLLLELVPSRWVHGRCELSVVFLGSHVVLHGSQTMAFKRVVYQRRLSTLRFNARLRTMHAIRCSDQVLICFAVTSEPNTFEPGTLVLACQEHYRVNLPLTHTVRIFTIEYAAQLLNRSQRVAK